MPKMFVHLPEGSLTPDARAQAASALTDLGMECERLADTPKVRQGVWVFFAEHAGTCLFQGGQAATETMVGLVVYALQGGLDEPGRRKLIAGATDILGRHIQGAVGPAAVYVVIQETPEADWGMYGQQVSLSALRAGG